MQRIALLAAGKAMDAISIFSDGADHFRYVANFIPDCSAPDRAPSDLPLALNAVNDFEQFARVESDRLGQFQA
jgi:hypothetical protein